MTRHAESRGYLRKMRIVVISKITDPEGLILETIRRFSECYFDSVKCVEGLRKMVLARFIENKQTGHVQFGKWQKHKHVDHAADAFKHIFAYLGEKKKVNDYDDVTQGYGMTLNYNEGGYGNTYLPPNIKRYY